MTTIPTLSGLYNQIITDLNAEFGITINPFGKAFLRALAAVKAAKLKLFYLALALLQKNIWVDTADTVAQGGTLERFGYVKLGRLPYAATQGQYNCTVTGTTGAVIPALTTFKSDDSSLHPSKLFILDVAYTMPSTTGTIVLRALEAGTGSNLSLTNTLTATAPIINVNQSALVTSIAVSAIDAETIEQYRAKAIEAYQLSPQGGSSADYRLWGSDATGVRQIYPYVFSGHSNEILVYVEAILSDSVGPPYQGVPTSTILTDVAADIEADPVTGKGRRPLGVLSVHTLPIIPKDIDITIDSGGVITSAQQITVTNALTAAIYDIRPFIAGADNAANRNDTISTFGIGNVIIQAIGGVIISSITLDVATVSVVSYNFDLGEIPYFNSITFI